MRQHVFSGVTTSGSPSILTAEAQDYLRAWHRCASALLAVTIDDLLGRGVITDARDRDAVRAELAADARAWFLASDDELEPDDARWREAIFALADVRIEPLRAAIIADDRDLLTLVSKRLRSGPPIPRSGVGRRANERAAREAAAGNDEVDDQDDDV